MRIAVGAAGGGGSRGQVREAQHGGPEHRALIELVDALGAIGAGQAGEGPAVNEAAAVHGAEGRRRQSIKHFTYFSLYLERRAAK